MRRSDGRWFDGSRADGDWEWPWRRVAGWKGTIEKALKSAVGVPGINDSADGEIGLDCWIRAGKARCRATGGEDPIAGRSTDWINGHQLFAFVIGEDPQVHVVKATNPVGTHQGTDHLHDFHQLFTGGVDGAAAAGAALALLEDFGGSGSQ